MRSPLLRRLAPLVLLVALLGAACGTTAANAATVNGHDISASSVTDELKIIRGKSCYQSALEQSYGGKLSGTGEGTFGSTFVAQLLSVRVYYALLEDRLKSEGVSITPTALSDATKATNDQLSSVCPKTTFPADYKAKLVHQEALIEVSSSQAGKDYLAKLQIACVSHILVKTKAEADALKSQLDGGAEFATLAKASSTDTGSKDQGGDLGCKPQGTYVTEFDKAVFTLPVGKVSDPIKTQFGYHLILVRSRRPGTEADVTSDSSQTALNQFLLDVVCGKAAKVSITPSFGTWDTSACKDSAGLAKVKPPAKPATK